MTDLTAPLNPARILKRAGGLRNSNGQVVKELDDGPPQPTSNGFSASIKRKFHGFKIRAGALARSKSFNGETTRTVSESEKKFKKPLSRSLTDVTTVESPISPRARSTPRSKSKRFSAQPRLQTLPSLSEGTSVDHVTSPASAEAVEPTSPIIGNVRVPQLLQLGTPMTKVSLKRHQKFVFRLDADLGQIVWESKKHKIIPIENIKEIRSGDDARYYRQQFHLSQEYEDRWLTIIYLLDGNYKTLHLIAATKDVFQLWNRTLRDLHAIRLELMRGLGNVEMRQALWEKHYWKGADEEQDQKLTFDEVEKLCRRLNINSTNEDLLRLFKQADTQNREFLDFDDFRRFVKLLKARPEIDRLYKKLRAQNNGVFDYGVFERFLKEEQHSQLSAPELRALFNKYSTSSPPVVTRRGDTCEHPDSASTPVITIDAFTAFLLSPDNSIFADQHNDVWQDMTRPLPEYFISSSHNTYLVGHQLVGVSTIEGYIRALLHSCRSVEVDIYDGELEPMIFHGKTFTSKVSLREVCQAIAKYGFVASPYPIIISAEVHCGLSGQDMIAEIMLKEFGDSLVKVPVDAEGVIMREKIEQLPSPEELKGKILLKAKNFNLLKSDSDSDIGYYTDPSSSASDSEAFYDVSKEPRPFPSPKEQRKEKSGRQSDSSMKDQLAKAGTNILKRVKSVRRRSSANSTGSSKAIISQSSPTSAVFSQSPPSMSFVSQSPPPIASSTPSMNALLKSKQPSGPPPPQSIASSLSLPIPSPSSPRGSKASLPVSLPIPIPGRRSDVGPSDRPKPKMSFALLALLVYTVGVKWRGINKKEEYAPEHMFSLSENMANKILRFGMWDLIKHTKTHLVRTYPKGTRLSSTNYQPHRFWASGAQLVAINWQTFDLGYMINHAMFQRNGRSGYVLKPDAIRLAQKDRLAKRTMHSFDVTIISAQQLPRPKDAFGHEVEEKAIVDPYVEVTIHIPDWPVVLKDKEKEKHDGSGGQSIPTTSPQPHSVLAAPAIVAATEATTLLPVALPVTAATNQTPLASTPGRSTSSRTSAVRKNGFNPVWEETLRIPFDCVGDMMDLIFVRFVVRQEDKKDTDEPLAVYCASLGSLQQELSTMSIFPTS
ncbi:1-phosphatidylinositol 4,5-bisphosphate phosphodiesterase 1 [Psilocybe cubensis]|uniref:1-phosphatidylinositol 4,5-bisphosphate phosphodiesterase 1 n=1 Tax=Psilocybe cubensis TaxID=181762 RepID=A0ACB8GFZ1_PSICU|nr:1-phosphatidylinositol 4,5-bisphosphate phosphodiesterase 1 [Psilocybe cubensis]KAH9474534.1 1-phosphatidylinositol 4,5-bisphosphate phosphodiesterase 1 [Psilocybe cubensis]